MNTSSSYSRRAFAALVGAQPTQIQRLVSSGRLPVDGEGRLTEAAVAAFRALHGATPKPEQPDDPGDEEAPPKAAAPRRRGPAEARDVFEVDLRRKHLDADMRALRVGRARGELLDRVTVEAEAVAVLAAVTAGLRSLAPRIVLELEAKIATSSAEVRPAAIRAVIDAEIEALIGSLHSAGAAESREEGAA